MEKHRHGIRQTTATPLRASTAGKLLQFSDDQAFHLLREITVISSACHEDKFI